MRIFDRWSAGDHRKPARWPETRRRWTPPSSTTRCQAGGHPDPPGQPRGARREGCKSTTRLAGLTQDYDARDRWRSSATWPPRAGRRQRRCPRCSGISRPVRRRHRAEAVAFFRAGTSRRGPMAPTAGFARLGSGRVSTVAETAGAPAVRLRPGPAGVGPSAAHRRARPGITSDGAGSCPTCRTGQPLATAPHLQSGRRCSRGVRRRLGLSVRHLHEPAVQAGRFIAGIAVDGAQGPPIELSIVAGALLLDKLKPRSSSAIAPDVHRQLGHRTGDHQRSRDHAARPDS